MKLVMLRSSIVRCYLTVSRTRDAGDATHNVITVTEI